MKWLFAIPLAIAGCNATPEHGRAADCTPVVFEVQQRQCPPLPLLPESATAAERTAFTRTVVLMYAQCAKGE